MKLQKNYITKQTYQGHNQGELIQAKQDGGFKSDFWLTFVQARDNNLKVKKGAKGTQILAVFDDDSNKDRNKSVRWFYVFNFDQVEERKVKS